jgi:hypothetical protein
MQISIQAKASISHQQDEANLVYVNSLVFLLSGGRKGRGGEIQRAISTLHRSITIVRILYRAAQTYSLYEKHYCTILPLVVFLKRHVRFPLLDISSLLKS